MKSTFNFLILFLFISSGLMAQMPYTGQATIKDGETFIVLSNMTINNLNIQDGGKLIIDSGVEFSYSGNFLINGKSAPQTPRIFINQRDYATFSYNTKTDAEQLPIKKIKIDFGYNVNADTRAEYTFDNANFADINPRYYSKLYEYSDVDSIHNNGYRSNDPALCAGDAPCYELTPVITITDNWGKCACINHDNTPCYAEGVGSAQCSNISAQNNLPLTKIFVKP